MHLSINNVICLSILAAGAFSSTVSQSQRVCRVKQIVGSVKIRRGASTKWLDARLKMPLKQKDAIRTFMESEAELETTEGSTVKVGENTSLEIKKLKGKGGTRETTMKVMSGAVLANVKKLVGTKSSFEFETPTATAAIRGTVVGLEVKKERTRIKVYEGKVLVTPRGSRNSVELKKNQMGTVEKGTKNVAVEKFSEKAPVNLSGTAKDSSAAAADSSSDSTSAGSDTAHVDTTEIQDTTSQGSATAVSNVSLSLASPADGAVVKLSSMVSVEGNVSPADAECTVNGTNVSVSSSGAFSTTLKAPGDPGSMDITVSADYNGTVKTVTRTLAVTSSNLVFSVTTPREGQEFSKPVIPAGGTVTPGASVSVLSIKLPVSPNGTFSGQVPIANEAGELTLEFEASIDGATQTITRRVRYKPEYRFILSSPPDRQTVSTTALLIKGEVLPANAEVSVMGRRLSVTSTGQFSGYITIPEEEGEVLLDFEINAGGLSKTETRRIIYKKPPDTYRPQLSASVSKGCLSVTVFDRTDEEEITLWYEIDGDKEYKTLNPNETFCVPLENGVHSYRVYAEDRARNISNTEILNNYSYLANATWIIQMRRPAGNVTLDIPPSSPAGEISHYPLEFTIENLPQDDMRLIREVIIVNKTNGRRVTLRTFTDNFIETDIELARQRNNQIQIEVHDINNVIRTQSFVINVR